MNAKLIPRLALILAACAVPALAQATVDQTITVNINLLTPLSWSAVTAMDFGKVMRPTVGTAVVILPSNSTTRSISGGNGQLVVGAVVNGAATLTSENLYSVKLGVGAIVNPTNLTCVLSAIKVTGPTLTNVILGGNDFTTAATDAFTFGGTMTITTAATLGLLSGSFVVTAIYN